MSFDDIYQTFINVNFKCFSWNNNKSDLYEHIVDESSGPAHALEGWE